MTARRIASYVLVLLTCAACAGPQLDANNLRTIQRLWGGARDDAARAATEAERAHVNEMDAAVQVAPGPSAALWLLVQPIAARGIDVWSGVDEGVRGSARERLRLLGEAIGLLSRNRQ